MIRLLGRVVALGVLGALVLWGLKHAPSPLVALGAWLIFGYLLRAAWGQIVHDVQWVGDKLGHAVRLGRPAGRYGRSARGDL